MLSTDIDWNAMADAPRDGTPILLLHREEGPGVGSWHAGGWSEGNHVVPAEFEGPAWTFEDESVDPVEALDNGEGCPTGRYDDGPVEGWKSIGA